MPLCWHLFLRAVLQTWQPEISQLLPEGQSYWTTFTHVCTIMTGRITISALKNLKIHQSIELLGCALFASSFLAMYQGPCILTLQGPRHSSPVAQLCTASVLVSVSTTQRIFWSGWQRSRTGFVQLPSDPLTQVNSQPQPLLCSRTVSRDIWTYLDSASNSVPFI